MSKTSKTTDMTQLGVMFVNVSEKTGNQYLNGEINGQKVVGFINTFTAKSGKNKGQEMTVLNIYEATDVDSSSTTTKSKSKTTAKKSPF